LNIAPTAIAASVMPMNASASTKMGKKSDIDRRPV